MMNEKIEELQIQEGELESEIEDKKEELKETRKEIEEEEGKSWCPRCEEWFDNDHECFAKED